MAKVHTPFIRNVIENLIQSLLLNQLLQKDSEVIQLRAGIQVERATIIVLKGPSYFL
jgi:hypothetical protein